MDGIWKIFNVDYDNITLAFIYAHYTYRDTGIIEDSHSENKTLDIAFYNKAKDSVNKKYKELHNAISGLKSNKPAYTKVQRLLPTILYSYSLSVNQWDEPICLDIDYNGNVAEFILDGEFKKACESGKSLGNQELMMRLNKDVYNLLHITMQEYQLKI